MGMRMEVKVVHDEASCNRVLEEDAPSWKLEEVLATPQGRTSVNPALTFVLTRKVMR